MKYNELFDTLQILTGRKPSVTELAEIIGVPTRTLYTRGQRNSSFSLKEIELIEYKYGVLLVKTNNNDIASLNYYPNVFASCGNGLTIFDESSEKIAVTKDIISGYSAKNSYSVISARGSSMSPTINDDDKLIIQHNQNEQIIDDNVYLFRYNDQLFIKRLVKNIDQLVCISENPRFEDRIIMPTADNFSIIGKVVGLFRNKV